jgi:hypothetical protein
VGARAPITVEAMPKRSSLDFVRDIYQFNPRFRRLFGQTPTLI